MKIASMFLSIGATCATAFGAGPYISKVYDYRPAPGQFVNSLPEYENGDNQATMNAKCLEYIGGQAIGSPVSLGAFGGYIIFGFDHAVVNSNTEYDFKIYGNTFANSTSTGVGSSEPGIVMVSVDANGNGIPDDEWFELKGSEHDNAATFTGMTIKYFAPDASRPLAADPDPSDAGVCDRSYIKWTSNHPAQSEGYIQRVTFHTQSYWPQWIATHELEFHGTRLPDNMSMEEGGQYTFRFFDWGYADNLPNATAPGFRISDAIKADGSPAELSEINFIKVYTGINQSCGSLGEGSTEICGAEDLHPDMVNSVAFTHCGNTLSIAVKADGIEVMNNGTPVESHIYHASGMECGYTLLQEGHNFISTAHLAEGTYILSTPFGAWKLRI